MLIGGEFINIGYHKDHPLTPGDPACVIEHMNVMSPEHELQYVALRHPLSIEHELLNLQFINADILDESGSLLHRLSADSILERKSYASRVAA